MGVQNSDLTTQIVDDLLKLTTDRKADGSLLTTHDIVKKAREKYLGDDQRTQGLEQVLKKLGVNKPFYLPNMVRNELVAVLTAAKDKLSKAPEKSKEPSNTKQPQPQGIKVRDLTPQVIKTMPEKTFVNQHPTNAELAVVDVSHLQSLKAPDVQGVHHLSEKGPVQTMPVFHQL